MGRQVVIYSDELYHHGIKGQRWGIRRFQNDDGTLTDEGRKRYGAPLIGSIRNKKDLRDQKKLDEYKKKGYSDEESQKLLANRKRFVRSLAIVGGLTVAGVVGYSMYKRGRARAMEELANNGHFLAKGSELQRVVGANGTELHDAFYASYDNVDKMKYRGMFGLANVVQEQRIPNRLRLNVVKDIKIASDKEAAEVYKSLYSTDKEFRRAADLVGNLVGNGSYTGFNIGLVLHDNAIDKSALMAMGLPSDFSFDKQWAKFYEKMKSAGFSAILDSNDRYKSGYNAIAPIIVFDKSAVAVGEIKKLGLGTIAKDLIGNAFYENGRKYIAAIGLAGVVGTTSAYDSRDEKVRTERDYRKRVEREKKRRAN